MKVLLPVFVFFLFAASGHAQQFDSATMAALSPPVRTQVEEHLAKAKRAQKHGKGLLITGAVLQAASFGALLIWGETVGYGALATFAAGSVVALTSIPFFITVKSRRSKARLLINNELNPPGPANTFHLKSRVYGLKWVVPLGK